MNRCRDGGITPARLPRVPSAGDLRRPMAANDSLRYDRARLLDEVFAATLSRALGKGPRERAPNRSGSRCSRKRGDPNALDARLRIAGGGKWSHAERTRTGDCLLL